jgi:AcrR family transcriptional regulator
MSKNLLQPSALSLRERKAALTRLGLLDAMVRRLRKQTFDEITVKELCADVAVSEPTFFNHFNTKHELLVLYVQLWSVEMKNAMEVPEATAFESLQRLFFLTAQASATFPRLMQEIVSYQVRHPITAATATPTKAELVQRFPSIGGVEHLGAFSVRSLIRSALDRAVERRELPRSMELETAVSVLAALFFGVPALHVDAHFAKEIFLSGLHSLWQSLGGRR